MITATIKIQSAAKNTTHRNIEELVDTIMESTTDKQIIHDWLKNILTKEEVDNCQYMSLESGFITISINIKEDY